MTTKDNPTATYTQVGAETAPSTGTLFHERFYKQIAQGAGIKPDMLNLSGSTSVWHQDQLSAHPIPGRSGTGEYADFMLNQKTLQEFYANIHQSEIYRGMFEGIGRSTIWAAQQMPNLFEKFMKSPLEFGRAEMHGKFKQIYSRPWEKRNTTAQKELLFQSQVPDFITTVAECQFSREIPLFDSQVEYEQFVQNGGMIGDVGSALMSTIMEAYFDDLYQASKQYFCGILRINPEPEDDPQHEGHMKKQDLEDSPMVELIECSKTCLSDRMYETIKRITNKEFKFKSRKYNPAQELVMANSSTMMVDSEYQYTVFDEKMANTYHNEYVRMGDEISFIWLDEMPTLSKGVWPDGFKYIATIVDNQGPGITPLNGGFRIESPFFNPQQASNSWFAHYELIYSMIPWTNRKYIFYKETT